MLIKKLMTGFTGMVALFTTVITCEGCGTDYGVSVPPARERCCESYGFDSDSYARCLELYDEKYGCPSKAEIEEAEIEEPYGFNSGMAIYGPASVMLCCHPLQDDPERYADCIDKYDNTGVCVLDEPVDPDE